MRFVDTNVLLYEALKEPGEEGKARRANERLLRFRVVGLTISLVLAAIATHRRFQISYWDVAIVEAARTAGCAVVLSEDLSDGQDYDGVRVENPFAL